VLALPPLRAGHESSAHPRRRDQRVRIPFAPAASPPLQVNPGVIFAPLAQLPRLRLAHRSLVSAISAPATKAAVRSGSGQAGDRGFLGPLARRRFRGPGPRGLRPARRTPKAGASLADLVTMTVFITDARLGDRFTQLRREIFADQFPSERLNNRRRPGAPRNCWSRCKVSRSQGERPMSHRGRPLPCSARAPTCGGQRSIIVVSKTPSLSTGGPVVRIPLAPPASLVPAVRGIRDSPLAGLVCVATWLRGVWFSELRFPRKRNPRRPIGVGSGQLLLHLPRMSSSRRRPVWSAAARPC